jgi:pyruvate formate lyase activating enzyme
VKDKIPVIQAGMVLALNAVLAIIFITGAAGYFNIKFFMENNPEIKEAMFYQRVDNGVKCGLCPRRCFLPEGFRGKCRVRINRRDTLYTMVYGRPASMNLDPIEKKPVFHLKPGSTAFSIATYGCNLRCAFCQNWQLSQSNPEAKEISVMTPGQIVEQALYYKSGSIAYTYSEPTVFYEYVYDTARLAKEKGLYNVYISAGYIEKEPLEALLPYLDVVKIDLKGFNDNFYKRIVDCRLSDILNTLKILKKHDKLVEIVNLVVPGLNDNMDEIRKMCGWIKREMGADTPLFFTRFMPQYLLTNLPATPVETLERAHDIAKEEGLNYVYVGNVPGHKYENTFCPRCGRVVVGRYGYTVTENDITGGKCRFCGQNIPGIW